MAKESYRTEAFLKDVLKKKGLQVGSRVVVSQKEWSSKRYVRQQKGKVIGIYPHHILCAMDDGSREYFRYNEILGCETTKVKVK